MPKPSGGANRLSGGAAADNAQQVLVNANLLAPYFDMENRFNKINDSRFEYIQRILSNYSLNQMNLTPEQYIDKSGNTVISALRTAGITAKISSKTIFEQNKQNFVKYTIDL